MLANQPGVDLTVVRLFAHIHDCKDKMIILIPEHGQRSAQFVLELKQMVS
jgi:rhodanese-related sulfurtransferase